MTPPLDLQLDLQVASSVSPLPDPALLEEWAKAALQGRRELAELSIRIVDEDESAELNGQYRNKPYPTNVLSFPAELPPELGLPLLGDLVICAPVVAREAEQQIKPALHHWAHMVVHGTLHLLGYDHIDDTEAEMMEGLEIRILAGLNIPNPYAFAEDSTQSHG